MSRNRPTAPEYTRYENCDVLDTCSQKAYTRVTRGPYKGVLRYHLGLIVPQPKTLCKIKVGADFRYWEEGKSLIFDDSDWHLVWNDSAFQRVVLFVDFVRPLPFPLSAVNRVTIWRIRRTPFITDMVANVRRTKVA